MTAFLKEVVGIVWGPPLIILLISTGLYLTYRLRGLQFTKLFRSLYLAFVKRKEDDHQKGDVSHFQALMTAMAATVGTGNIAGVAVALAAGGPGALFWMWMTGLVGMATKYAEAVLGVKYRITDDNGDYRGGPMYYIERGLGWAPLAIIFAVLASISAFGTGNMTQSNSVAGVIYENFGLEKAWTGLILAGLTLAVVVGGIRSIANVTSVLVPFMVGLYMVVGIAIVVLYFDQVPYFFSLVVESAFNPQAAGGGLAGVAVMTVIQQGVARGLFSNESGMGSAPIAAAAAKTKHPVSQALVSMTQTFIDTLVVCSITGFALVVTGAWSGATTEAGTALKGAPLTAFAFEQGIDSQWGSYVVTIALVFFAYSTILGWAYYGETSVEYVFQKVYRKLGLKAENETLWVNRTIKSYHFLFSAAVFFGSIYELKAVFAFSDIMNGLMAIPNLIGLLLLAKVVVAETNDYLSTEDGSSRRSSKANDS